MSAAIYILSIIAANLAVAWWGIISFAGITFPAGSLIIGLTFSARDFVQRRYGKWGCWAWMALACAITAAFNWRIAVASSAAFLIGESVDWIVFTYSPGSFRKRLVLSNLFSTPIDSAAFVILAFGWNWPAIWGQAIVKFAASLLALAVVRNK